MSDFLEDAAPNYRPGVCCSTCKHFDEDYEAYGDCTLFKDEDGVPLRGSAHNTCDDHEAKAKS